MAWQESGNTTFVSYAMLVNATYANCTRAIGTYKLVFVRIFFFKEEKKVVALFAARSVLTTVT